MSDDFMNQGNGEEAPRRDFRSGGRGNSAGGDRRGGGGGGGGGGFRPRRRKQKVSKFYEWGIEDIDYKDIERLKEFLSESSSCPFTFNLK